MAMAQYQEMAIAQQPNGARAKTDGARVEVDGAAANDDGHGQ